MAEKEKSIIRNPEFRDSSSKLIFGDNTLSSQFFRDYADLEILRNIRPEDVEDVSERYVPLYSTERESDTVKKVDISRYLEAAGYLGTAELQAQDGAVHPEMPEPPLFVVSLVEHKTKVEYNDHNRKTSGCEADICFSVVINEQASDKIGQEALKARACESGSHADAPLCRPYLGGL